MGRLKRGDYIKCYSHAEMKEVLETLKKQGYKVDYCYEKDGKQGMWIVIDPEYS